METKFGIILKNKFNGICNNKQMYNKYLNKLLKYNVNKFKKELHNVGILKENIINPETNFFMKIINGSTIYPNVLKENNLEQYDKSYQIFNNLAYSDNNYLSNHDSHLSKVSMSKFHKFICPKTSNPTYMNAIMFANNKSQIHNTVSKLTEMKKVAILYASNQNITNVGLYVHVFPLNSIHLFHVHILDENNLGPTFYHLKYKNLKLDDVIETLRERY